MWTRIRLLHQVSHLAESLIGNFPCFIHVGQAVTSPQNDKAYTAALCAALHALMLDVLKTCSSAMLFGSPEETQSSQFG